MRSIELTFDEETEARVRADWAALAAIGLPSLAGHTGATNRPHLTLAAGEDLSDGQELRDAVAMLPLELTFGGVILFGESRRGVVLARQVVTSSALLELHRRAHDAAPGAVDLTRPDNWTPHVTLARRMPADDLGRALAAIGPAVGAIASAARLWDSHERTVTPLG